LKGPDDRQWHEENDYVLRNVDTSIRNPYDKLVHAASVPDGLVPCKSDGTADKDAREGRPAAVGYDNTQDSEARYAEVSYRKDTEILYKNGYLCHSECEVVDPDARPE